MHRPRILLVEDHPFFRDGVRDSLLATGRFRLFGEAGDANSALALCKSDRPDVVVLDIDLPGTNGFGAMRSFQAAGIPAPVIFLTLHRDQAFVDEALNLGASGYVLKDDPREYLVDAIKAALRGDVWLSPKLTQALLRRRAAVEESATEQPCVDCLSPAERRVALLVAENLTSREIARRLGTSQLTIETHRRNAARKLGVGGPHGFLQFVQRNRARLSDF